MPPFPARSSGRLPVRLLPRSARAPKETAAGAASRPRPDRHAAPRTIAAAVAIVATALAGPAQASAQAVEDPVLPRGAFLVEVRGFHAQASELEGPGGQMPFGSPFFGAAVTPALFPELGGARDRLRELTGDASEELRLGTLDGRFEVNEQAMPLRAGYGVLDRITVGVTVPFVRRRTDTLMRLSAEGANVGMNPALGPAGTEVTAFRNEAGAALDSLRLRVAESCAEQGEDSAPCVSGRELEARTEGFLDLLGAAWDEGAFFPLVGTGAGSSLRGRWDGTLSELGEWGIDGPGTLPLSRTPISQETFRQDLVASRWGSDGFPLETPEAFLELGDVEVHVVAGILRTGEPGPVGTRIRSAVQGTLRLPTGTADSLALVTPLEPPRGYGGLGLRWLTDLQHGARAAVLLDVEWNTFRTNELTLLAVDPNDPWNPEAARVTVNGAPGHRLRAAVTPRLVLGGSLALGAGYEWHRAAAGSWSTSGAAPVATVSREAATQHRAVVDFRFAGFDPPVADRLRFPIELVARASWTIAGSGTVPVERRLEMGIRLLRPRR